MFSGAFTPSTWPLRPASVLMSDLGMVKITCEPCCMTEPSAMTSNGSCFSADGLDVGDVVAAGDVELAL